MIDRQLPKFFDFRNKGTNAHDEERSVSPKIKLRFDSQFAISVLATKVFHYGHNNIYNIIPETLEYHK